MNTENFQKSTAYLDGALMSLDGDKVIIISFGALQERFYVSNSGEVNRCGEQGPVTGNESDFERYRMAFLEALMDGGSLIVRQIAVGELKLPEALGSGVVPLDYLSAAKVGPKGVRSMKADELKKVYQQGADGAVEYHDFPSKEQVKIAMLNLLETEQS
ncbi:hypothetical protein [Neptunomonas japonica]|uniref:Uncharacterized protein n=1 Tax=Neptunomonas japonica JAMM 1380 TaxID=1441457 RepID=A0A7R6PQJ6_9GAMM|nr:hypothetical protein [Neptunomonas japonica]BBB30777.1 hypothetical protein NEJAP_2837 [Neptunomonas japonica JAMM 1380]